VGHSRGQGAERCQPIGQHQVALKLLAFGHVTAEQNHGTFTLKLGEQIEHVQSGAASIAAQEVNLGRRRRPSAGQHLAQAFGLKLAILTFDQIEKLVRGQLFRAVAMKRVHRRAVGVDDAAASADQNWLGRDLDQPDQSFVGLGRHRSKARRVRPGLAVARRTSKCVAGGEAQH